MGKIRSTNQIGNLETAQDIARFLQPFITDVSNTLNGNVDVVENLRVSIVDHTFADTAENKIAHNLGRIPVGYIVIYKNGNQHVFSSGTASTEQYIYLQASNLLTVKLLFF